jgi:tetratricopeptide repeat protein 8
MNLNVHSVSLPQEQMQYGNMESVSQEDDAVGDMGRRNSAPKDKAQNVMNAVFLASSLLRRRKFDACLKICDEQLAINQFDEAVWFIKTRCLTEKNYIDDTEMEEEGVADLLLDSNAMQTAARPGTSLKKPTTKAGPTAGGINQNVRPVSGMNRPLSGFARPATQSRGQTGNARDVATAFKRVQTGSSRPMSMAGRFVRLGTASMLSDDKGWINSRRDFNKDAKKPVIAKAICNFLIYSDHDARKALELAAICTKEENFTDWWWKARLGKCYYQLGMLREAEQQFRSANKEQSMVVTHLELCKVHLRFDQPQSALDDYVRGAKEFEGETHLLLGMARVLDQLNELDRAQIVYHQVLQFDSSNAEAIACLAAHHFYSDQPELGLRYYK